MGLECRLLRDVNQLRVKPYLTPQDKLALALTSAGSQRKLAALLGVSHQRVGRWLREGQPGGVKQIPVEAERSINTAFSIHKEITRAQARADKIPYFPDVPVYSYRPFLRNGKKGERLVAPHTEFIQQDLRMLYLAYAHRSGKFWGVSIRSVIDWYVYVTDQKRTSRDNYMTAGGELVHVPTGEIIRQTVKPIYTRAEDFRRGSSIAKAIHSVEEKLHGKHERSAIHFADEYLLQLMPEDYDPNEKRFDKVAAKAQTRRSRKSYKNRKG